MTTPLVKASPASSGSAQLRPFGIEKPHPWESKSPPSLRDQEAPVLRLLVLSLEATRGPEGVPEAVVEVEEAFEVHGEHIPRVVVNVARAPDVPHQLAFRQLSGPPVAQERTAAKHSSQQEPWLP